MKKYSKIIILPICVALLLGAFALLHASIAAANVPAEGGTLSGEYTVGGTMNLNGKIKIASDTSLKITGSGTINWAPSVDQDCAFENSGTLIIEGTSATNRIVIDAKTIDDTFINNLGELVLKNVTIQNVGSSASKKAAHGGAIKTEDGTHPDRSTKVTLDNVIIKNCYAREGGGLYVGNNVLAEIDINNSQFINCYAYPNSDSDKYLGGGGIAVRNQNVGGLTDIDIYGKTVFENCDSTQEGGAILIKRETPEPTESNPNVDANKLANTTLLIRDVTIKNCDAREGGGIHIDGKAVVNFDIRSSLIQNCTTTATSEDDRNEYGGAGVNIRNSNPASDYNFENTVIENCTAYWNSGGIRLGIEMPADADPKTPQVRIIGCTLKNNEAGNGSAIHFNRSGMSTVSISRTIFDSNISRYKRLDTGNTDAYNYGGTLRSDKEGSWTAVVSDCVFKNNQSTYAGGAVYWNQSNDEGSITIEDCHFYNNKADNYTQMENMGGALFFEAKNSYVTGTSEPIEVFTGDKIPQGGLNGTIIERNYAELGGGVAYKSVGSVRDVENGSLELGKNVLIRNNEADYGGGVAFLVRQAKLAHLEGNPSTIAQNAIFDVVIDGAEILGNTAIQGGGLYMSKEMHSDHGTICYMNLTVESGRIDGNSATSDGGAIYIKGYARTPIPNPEYKDPGKTSVVINSGSISGNNTTGVNRTGTGSGTIYIKDGSITMSGGDILNNTVASDGGGFNVTGGSVTMINGNVSGNTATSGSGGGFNVTGGSLTISGGIVSSNTAGVNGGGLNVSGGDIHIGHENCKAKLQDNHDHPELSYNKANGSGGGVAVSGGVSVSNGRITMYCGDVIHNTANGNSSSNNVIVDGAGSFTIYNGYLGLGVDGTIEDSRPGVDIIYSNNISGNLVTTTMTKAVKPGYEFTPRSTTDTGFPANFFIRDGYIFKGWSTSSVATTADFAAVSEEGIVSGTLVAGLTNTTVYAVWEPESYTLTIRVDKCPENDHVTVFNVKSISLSADGLDEVDFDVMVQGNGNVELYLPKGIYTVTLEKAWRYNYDAVKQNNIDLTANNNEVTLTVGSVLNGKWLNYYFVA